jgi:Mn-dependent DtxR family transcriptional regulator
MISEEFDEQVNDLLGKEMRGRLNDDLILMLLLQNYEEFNRPTERGFRGFRGTKRDNSIPDGLTTREIADELGVPQSTAATAVKRLKDDGLVTHSKGMPTKITKTGKQVAEERLKHHRLLEVMLVDTLALDHETAHNEALKFMLVASCQLIRDIDRRYEYPEACPAGGVIPDNDDCENKLLNVMMH